MQKKEVLILDVYECEMLMALPEHSTDQGQF
jgi:hypothetical protein